MLGAEGPSERLEDLLEEVTCSREIALTREGAGRVVHGDERVGVLWAEGPGARFEDLLIAVAGSREVALLS